MVFRPTVVAIECFISRVIGWQLRLRDVAKVKQLLEIFLLFGEFIVRVAHRVVCGPFHLQFEYI